ncbi:hypothetical protein DM47_1651 [Burkholderia mallei]|nr:hypothetical protein DM46_1063 [Burkholderia mallei]KOT08494.1 hypothetical protein DM77_1855 [Burkholderia mallei]KOT18324.1 hypothetical protein DM47_1651 [Burkholderia mallei]
MTSDCRPPTSHFPLPGPQPTAHSLVDLSANHRPPRAHCRGAPLSARPDAR